MRYSILAVLACLLLGSFVIAGCGSDSDDTTAGGASATEAGTESGGEANSGDGDSSDSSEAPSAKPTSESKAEFTARANELCEKRRNEIKKKSGEIFTSAQESGGSPEAALNSLIEDAVVPGLEGEIEELQELGVPEGNEDQVEEIIAAIESMLASAREDPQAFVKNPAEFNAANKVAVRYGLEACGALG